MLAMRTWSLPAPMLTDSLSVASAVILTSCAPSSEVTVPVVVAVAPTKLAAILAAAAPVTANVVRESLATVNVEDVEPDAEPEDATFTVSIPLAVTDAFPVTAAPFKLTVIESVAPDVTAAELKATDVFVDVPVTFTAGMAFKPVTETSAVEPVLVTVVTPVKPVASTDKAPTVAVAEIVSTPVEVTPVPTAAAAVVVTCNVSAPSPPAKTSPAVNVVPEAVYVSAPAPPTNVVSTPVVRAKVAFVTATTSEVAKEPDLVPAVCDFTKDASVLALKDVAYEPYVGSAVIMA